MSKTYFVVTLAALWLVSPAVFAADQPASQPGMNATATQQVPKELTDTIDRAIALLEAGKNKEAVLLLFDPATMTGKDMDKGMAKFATYAPRLLKTLKETKGSTPKVTDTTVVYPSKEKSLELRFKKVDDHWYLQ